MEIVKKGWLARLFCQHEYQEGILSTPGKPTFYNLSGDRVTTICTKCGKIKGSRFVPNADGS